ncbi:Aldose 1-epimerase precursor [Rhodobacteraceae bacterium THAF1]|uniref:aldose epimerase family protein n=1 Tax=Palleronia sp. THAF1 TaxID=2587842 RepID=UPI000F3B27DD|nr:aldose epimerase family protein [Palleronia sp. THAF1]QFU07715.1 Aldose 1-epimerase precursor [Palleronia sp. THAF1]VDC23172.1 Aldose 1-epimerase precursor [Rhodobacteraceae bacterium THAF1]
MTDENTMIELRNDDLHVHILRRGAVVQVVRMVGDDFSVTLGAPSLEDYTDPPMSHFGAVMGPVANRIAGASGQIDGRTMQMEANENGCNALHSGAAGLNLKDWSVEDHGTDHVTLRVDCPDGEGGLPGNRVFRARYALNDGTLVQELTAETDAPTWVNLAHHGYWTMQAPTGWSGQRLTIAADHYLPVDADTIPTGQIAPVADTPFDFRGGILLDADVLPLLDHNFCLTNAPGPLRFALRMEGADRAMEMHTTAPGLQVFGMHKFGIDGPTVHGAPYPKGAALAFEPQMWPDAPGRAEWPSIVTRPNIPYRQITEYRFSRMAR